MTSNISQHKRKSIGKKARFEVFKRDGFQCQYCGAHPPAVILHVDHIQPVSVGGDNHVDNLITSCESCNLGKGARLLSAIPESLSAKAERIKEQEEQIKGYSEIAQARKEREHEEAWDVADIFVNHFCAEGIRKDWLQSIKTFIRKLGVVETCEAMEKAVARKPRSKNACFPYFCGICWNIIRDAENGQG